MDEGNGGRHRRPKPFGLLFVCTGNICRSPFAEVIACHLLARAMGSRAAVFDIASAGSRAAVGASMHPYTRRELGPWGLDGAGHADRFRARELTADLIGRSDLVLGLGRIHRTAVLEQEPAALPIAFTLREFARLTASVDRHRLSADPTCRAQELVALAWRNRASGRAADPRDDEVPDPVGGAPRVHHHAAELIAAAVYTIVGTFTETAVRR